MNSPQNENGKTNLPLSLCQETGSHLTVERGSIRTGSRLWPRLISSRSPMFNFGLFYYSASLDRSESYVLVSARLESSHPVNS